MTLDECETVQDADAIIMLAFFRDGDAAVRTELLERLRAQTLPAVLRARLNVLVEGAVREAVRQEFLPAISQAHEVTLLDACRRLTRANAEQAMLIGILLDALEAADVCGLADGVPLQEIRARATGIAATGAAIDVFTRRCYPGVH